ncbi:unnamed protein product, partial [Adineta steineri]
NESRKKAKEEKELIYSSLFPSYEFRHSYDIQFINRCTTFEDIDKFISITRNTLHFTVDTESDYYTNQAALMQIAFLPSAGELVLVLLIEVQFLSDRSSCLFS